LKYKTNNLVPSGRQILTTGFNPAKYKTNNLVPSGRQILATGF